MNRAERLERLERIDLYPVTCENLSNGRSDLEVLEGVLAGGARIVQLREKHWEKRRLFEVAVVFRERTRRHGALLIINDHVDVALAVDADGVHLGQEDLPLEAARRIAPELILGASAHSLEEALRAQDEGADYVNIGPIFPTKTKEKVAEFLGPEAISRIAPHLRVPFTTMGGIHAGNIDRVLAAGARKVAMVTGITKAPDIAERVRELRERIRSVS